MVETEVINLKRHLSVVSEVDLLKLWTVACLHLINWKCVYFISKIREYMIEELLYSNRVIN